MPVHTQTKRHNHAQSAIAADPSYWDIAESEQLMARDAAAMLGHETLQHEGCRKVAIVELCKESASCYGLGGDATRYAQNVQYRGQQKQGKGLRYIILLYLQNGALRNNTGNYLFRPLY